MITIKQGERFAPLCRWFDQQSGTPNDLTGVEIRCQIRGACFAEELAVQITDAADGRYILSSASTENWPAGHLRADVRYITPEGDVLTDAFTVAVGKTITRINITDYEA